MQTFMPFPSFPLSVGVLDYRRLGKQRVEVKQIYNALTGVSTGWANHPATRMWAGYERTLLVYGMKVCEEWVSRGYKDNLYSEFHDKFWDMGGTPARTPWWMGNEAFHLSHRSNLLRKDPSFYGPKFEEGLPDNLPYVWPV